MVTAKQKAAAKANLEKARAARRRKRKGIDKARKANQAQVAFQKANPGTPIVRLASRPRYNSDGTLRSKGKNRKTRRKRY